MTCGHEGGSAQIYDIILVRPWYSPQLSARFGRHLRGAGGSPFPSQTCRGFKKESGRATGGWAEIVCPSQPTNQPLSKSESSVCPGNPNTGCG